MSVHHLSIVISKGRVSPIVRAFAKPAGIFSRKLDNSLPESIYCWSLRSAVGHADFLRCFLFSLAVDSFGMMPASSSI
jgi:hypothetical protein